MNWNFQWIGRVVVGLMVLTMAADASLWLYVKTDKPENNPFLFRYGVKPEFTPPPDGFAADGEKAAAPKSPSGWVVRYSAQSCKYCRKDENLWNPLQSELQRMGYQVFVVVPSARDEFSHQDASVLGTQQLTYVNMGWIKQFRLSETPTVLIFNNDGLIWSHQGTLGASDPASALDATKSGIGRRR
jgi:hypothetical protein